MINIDQASLPMLDNIVYQHCNQQVHSILSMRLYIIDKIYLTALLRTQKEDYIAIEGQQQGLVLGGAGPMLFTIRPAVSCVYLNSRE